MQKNINIIFLIDIFITFQFFPFYNRWIFYFHLFAVFIHFFFPSCSPSPFFSLSSNFPVPAFLLNELRSQKLEKQWVFRSFFFFFFFLCYSFWVPSSLNLLINCLKTSMHSKKQWFKINVLYHLKIKRNLLLSSN